MVEQAERTVHKYCDCGGVSSEQQSCPRLCLSPARYWGTERRPEYGCKCRCHRELAPYNQPRLSPFRVPRSTRLRSLTRCQPHPFRHTNRDPTLYCPDRESYRVFRSLLNFPYMANFGPRSKTMSISHRQACISCLRSFSLFRSEHRCGLCGEAVCRKCLTKDTASRFRPWRRSQDPYAIKVCRLCDESSGSTTSEGLHLMTSQPCATWQCSPASNIPAQLTDRAATTRTPAHSYFTSASCRDIRQPWRQQIYRGDSLPRGTKFDAFQGSDNLSATEDQEILTVNTDDMTKASATTMFLSQINTSICEQREILRCMQQASESRRTHAKTS